MNIKEQIKAYWDRIGKIEERISELSKKGLDYSTEVVKRKSLLSNIKFLEKKERGNKKC